MRLWRLTRPLEAHFAQIKDRASKRGHVFTLTKQQFIDLVADTGYLEGRGRKACHLHIDRIDPARGYEPGNVRVITAKENCAKSDQDKRIRREIINKKIAEAATDENNPF